MTSRGRSTGEFAVVFGLIWLAWLNGTVYHDLHGREDIRTRAFTFAQMLLIVLLAIYVGDAAREGGRGFALVYATFILLLIWLWYTVQRQDDERFMQITRRYQILMVIILVVVLVSAFQSNEARIVMWAVLLVVVLASFIVLGSATELVEEGGGQVTGSMVERFGLFTIIVLGEVVVGVAEGLTNAFRDTETVVTGIVALIGGFGMWWNYFDLTGGRVPSPVGRRSPIWMMTQLPWTMSIAAGGAAMVSIIEHASDVRAPVGATWLLAGSVAVGLLCIALLMRNARRLSATGRRLQLNVAGDGLGGHSSYRCRSVATRAARSCHCHGRHSILGVGLRRVSLARHRRSRATNGMRSRDVALSAS